MPILPQASTTLVIILASCNPRPTPTQPSTTLDIIHTPYNPMPTSQPKITPDSTPTPTKLTHTVV